MECLRPRPRVWRAQCRGRSVGVFQRGGAAKSHHDVLRRITPTTFGAEREFNELCLCLVGGAVKVVAMLDPDERMALIKEAAALDPDQPITVIDDLAKLDPRVWSKKV